MIYYLVTGAPGSGSELYAKKFYEEQASILNALSGISTPNMRGLYSSYQSIGLVALSIGMLNFSDEIEVVVLNINNISQSTFDDIIKCIGKDDTLIIKYFKNDNKICKHNLQYLPENSFARNINTVDFSGYEVEYVDPICRTELEVIALVLIKFRILESDYYNDPEIAIANMALGSYSSFISYNYNKFYRLCNYYGIKWFDFNTIRDLGRDAIITLKILSDNISPYVYKSIDEF